MDANQTLASFEYRHLGSDNKTTQKMLGKIGVTDLEQLIDQTVPASIRLKSELSLPSAQSESEFLSSFKQLMNKNSIAKSFIGMGYTPTQVPTIILRNVLENPGWYTQYTPYQAEIAQGRLEALLNFQTMICSLTGMDIANASLLDEATAAAEAMAMLYLIEKKNNPDKPRSKFALDTSVFPQIKAVIKTRATPMDIDIIEGDVWSQMDLSDCFGVYTQNPSNTGEIRDVSILAQKCKASKTLIAVGTDPMSLVLAIPPGKQGATIVLGSAQRFGIPMGFGGPHAAYFATHTEYARMMPGRIIGVSQDAKGKRALRMALQTREQHIRREKASSNICTSQVLLAIMSSFYAVYHGPDGLKQIASTIHNKTKQLAKMLGTLGYTCDHISVFDTLTYTLSAEQLKQVKVAAEARLINFRYFEDGKCLGITLYEGVLDSDLKNIADVFSAIKSASSAKPIDIAFPANLLRSDSILTDAAFNSYTSETEMLRYIYKLQSRDLSLTTSMIPLGSCTMKLNATTEMIPVTWAENCDIHPFAPESQTLGYTEMIKNLSTWLGTITGLPGVSMQPNSGAQGEYAGLLVMRAYHHAQGHVHRNTVLIPSSAHGTNPASASMAGLDIRVVPCDSMGNIDVQALKIAAAENADKLFGLMVTYPSTHGVFEDSIRTICDSIHEHGGLVYMDGANMNAQVGLCNPGSIGADVCHLNLHKTFCIPHGGGGPGMGPICVTEKLTPYLPVHPLHKASKAVGAVSAAHFGSASILAISYAYIAMMGTSGLKKATQMAILNANYLMQILSEHYTILYRGENGRVAHEFIIDLRPLKKSSGVEAEDIAKRLMDYGFHAPTVSFPVAGTIMIEPTESESKAELDKFATALICIRAEIARIEKGEWDSKNNPLKNAPHPAHVLTEEPWTYPYTRVEAVYPADFVREHKFWPTVARVDNTYGDKNLFCRCS